MTKKYLFEQLCDVADALQAECARIDFSPHKIALEAICERLDVVIDTVLEEGVTDNDAPPRRPGEGRWRLPGTPTQGEEEETHA